MNTKFMAAYLRVSTDSQDTNAQQNALCGWLEAQHVNLDDVVRYEDVGYSGSLPAIKRPAFAKLVEDIKTGKVTKVVLFEASRAVSSQKLV